MKTGAKVAVFVIGALLAGTGIYFATREAKAAPNPYVGKTISEVLNLGGNILGLYARDTGDNIWHILTGPDSNGFYGLQLQGSPYYGAVKEYQIASWVVVTGYNF